MAIKPIGGRASSSELLLDTNNVVPVQMCNGNIIYVNAEVFTDTAHASDILNHILSSYGISTRARAIFGLFVENMNGKQGVRLKLEDQDTVKPMEHYAKYALKRSADDPETNIVVDRWLFTVTEEGSLAGTTAVDILYTRAVKLISENIITTSLTQQDTMNSLVSRPERYLNECRRIPSYGSVSFKEGSIDGVQSALVLSIRSVVFFKNREKIHFTWDQIISWNAGTSEDKTSPPQPESVVVKGIPTKQTKERHVEFTSIHAAYIHQCMQRIAHEQRMRTEADGQPQGIKRVASRVKNVFKRSKSKNDVTSKRISGSGEITLATSQSEPSVPSGRTTEAAPSKGPKRDDKVELLKNETSGKKQDANVNTQANIFARRKDSSLDLAKHTIRKSRMRSKSTPKLRTSGNFESGVQLLAAKDDNLKENVIDDTVTGKENINTSDNESTPLAQSEASSTESLAKNAKSLSTSTTNSADDTNALFPPQAQAV